MTDDERFSLGYQLMFTPVFRDGKWDADDMEWYLPSVPERSDQQDGDRQNVSDPVSP